MSKRKESIDYASESKQEKFRRIVNPRFVKLGKTYNSIIRLAKQSSYEISQEDANILVEHINELHTEFIKWYSPLCEGIKKRTDVVTVESLF